MRDPPCVNQEWSDISMQNCSSLIWRSAETLQILQDQVSVRVRTLYIQTDKTPQRSEEPSRFSSYVLYTADEFHVYEVVIPKQTLFGGPTWLGYCNINFTWLYQVFQFKTHPNNISWYKSKNKSPTLDFLQHSQVLYDKGLQSFASFDYTECTMICIFFGSCTFHGMKSSRRPSTSRILRFGDVFWKKPYGTNQFSGWESQRLSILLNLLVVFWSSISAHFWYLTWKLLTPF